MKYDEDTKDIAKREFDIWNGLSHPNLLVLHDAYLVRKYLVLISEMYVLQFGINVITVFSLHGKIVIVIPLHIVVPLVIVVPLTVTLFKYL